MLFVMQLMDDGILAECRKQPPPLWNSVSHVCQWLLHRLAAPIKIMFVFLIWSLKFWSIIMSRVIIASYKFLKQILLHWNRYLVWFHEEGEHSEMHLQAIQSGLIDWLIVEWVWSGLLYLNLPQLLPSQPKKYIG